MPVVARKAPRVGFEPTTYRLTAGRSTVELSGNGAFTVAYFRGEIDMPGIGQPAAAARDFSSTTLLPLAL